MRCRRWCTVGAGCQSRFRQRVRRPEEPLDWRERARDMMASTGQSWEGDPVRLLPAPSIATLFTPRVNPVQVRRLLRLGIILRWVAIAFAGLAGVLVPKPPPHLDRVHPRREERRD